MKKILLALCTMFTTNGALGGMTIELYKEASIKKGGERIVSSYVTGLGEGLFWANAATEVSFKQRLYCQPTNLALNGHNYIEILNREIEEGAHAQDTELGVALLVGLQKTFPCS